MVAGALASYGTGIAASDYLRQIRLKRESI
jgi:hypothetical protein